MIRAQMKLLFKRKEFQVTFAGMMLLIAYVFLSQCYTAFGTDATYYLSADKLFIGRANAHDINIILPFLLPLVCVLPFAGAEWKYLPCGACNGDYPFPQHCWTVDESNHFH